MRKRLESRIRSSFHEDLGRLAEVKRASNRSFGVQMAAILGAYSAWIFFRQDRVSPALGVSMALLVAATFRPLLLGPVNRAWAAFGLLLGRIVNPVIMALTFFLVFTPVGWLARLLGKDSLRLNMRSEAASYWILRDPPGPSGESLWNQY
jgi:hypothetical protein